MHRLRRLFLIARTNKVNSALPSINSLKSSQNYLFWYMYSENRIKISRHVFVLSMCASHMSSLVWWGGGAEQKVILYDKWGLRVRQKVFFHPKRVVSLFLIILRAIWSVCGHSLTGFLTNMTGRLVKKLFFCNVKINFSWWGVGGRAKGKSDFPWQGGKWRSAKKLFCMTRGWT